MPPAGVSTFGSTRSPGRPTRANDPVRASSSRPRARTAAPERPEPSTATPMPAHASSATAWSTSSAAQSGQSSPLATASSGVSAPLRTVSQASATSVGGRPSSPADAVHAAPRGDGRRGPVDDVGWWPLLTGRGRHHEPVRLGLLEDDLREGEHVWWPIEQVVDDRLAGDGSPQRVERGRPDRHQSTREPTRAASWCSVLPTSSSTARASPAAAIASANAAASSSRSVKRIQVARRCGSRKLFW